MPYMLVKTASADRGGMSYSAWTSKKGGELLDKNMSSGARAERQAAMAGRKSKTMLRRVAKQPNIKLPAAAAKKAPAKAFRLVRKLAHV